MCVCVCARALAGWARFPLLCSREETERVEKLDSQGYVCLRACVLTRAQTPFEPGSMNLCVRLQRSPFSMQSIFLAIIVQFCLLVSLLFWPSLHIPAFRVYHRFYPFGCCVSLAAFKNALTHLNVMACVCVCLWIYPFTLDANLPPWHRENILASLTCKGEDNFRFCPMSCLPS